MRFLLTTIMLSLALPLGAAEVPKKIPLTPEAFYVVRDGKTVFGTITSKWKDQNDCNAALRLGMRKHPKYTTHSSNVGKVQFIPKTYNRRYSFRGYAFAEVTWGESFAQLKQEADLKKEMGSLERYKGILNRAKDDSHYQGLLAKLGTTEELVRNFLLLCCRDCHERMMESGSSYSWAVRQKDVGKKLEGIGLWFAARRLRGYPVKIEDLMRDAGLESSSARPLSPSQIAKLHYDSLPIPLELDGSGGCGYWDSDIFGRFSPSEKLMKSLENELTVPNSGIYSLIRSFQHWWFCARTFNNREGFEQVNFAPVFFEIAKYYMDNKESKSPGTVDLVQEAFIITVYRDLQRSEILKPIP